ncbi:magnesium transporter [Tessaracoccus oleiagri]|uniref:Magnesium transporter MgtE n=1 Tax=Tessaracoccus oleiagri TaxID=686624 RepID=A0A1G9J6C8_9ACTN|nr:magnesium transporter [Tessaracoccus oleiagri]SDL32785.1 magnesium transporter [Tessaracoccus oleiagri]
MTQPADVASVTNLLERGTASEQELRRLADLAATLPTSELLYVLRSVPSNQAAILYRVLDKDTALDVFEDLAPADQADLIHALRSSEIADLIEDLDPDDRAQLFDQLPASVADRLMRGLDPEERRMTTAVLGYPRDSIGRYMSPEVVTLHEGSPVREALARVRGRIDHAETIYLLPVVNDSRQLRGVVGLRRLLATEPDALVGSIMREASSAPAVARREDVARRFLADKLLAMPIVDDEQRVVGILTFDDAVAIMEEEDAEDAARSGGAETFAGSYLAAPIWRIVRSRIVWLLVLGVSAILTVQVLELYEARLEQVVVLALFIPLLTGTGGNTGNQAATTVTRALAVGEVRVRDLPRVVWRELRVGAVLGTVLGAVGFGLASLVYGLPIGLVIGLTLLSVCTMSAVVGGLMPLVARKVGADPAVFSNPFISTFCDATGLVIYFSIAAAVLNLA